MSPTVDTSSVSSHTSDCLRVVCPGLWILQGDQALGHSGTKSQVRPLIQLHYASIQATKDGVHVEGSRVARLSRDVARGKQREVPQNGLEASRAIVRCMVNLVGTCSRQHTSASSRTPWSVEWDCPNRSTKQIRGYSVWLTLKSGRKHDRKTTRA